MLIVYNLKLSIVGIVIISGQPKKHNHIIFLVIAAVSIIFRSLMSNLTGVGPCLLLVMEIINNTDTVFLDFSGMFSINLFFLLE